MFSKIDDRLIRLAQWIVRQIELYTSVDHIKIGQILSIIHTSVALVLSVIILQSLFNGSLFGLFFIPGMYGQLQSHNQLRMDILGTKIKPLPREIFERFSHRICYILILTILIFVSGKTLYLFSQEEGLQKYFFVLLFFTVTVVGSYATTVCIEYFLCTTSLPPGEKERKKQEKEMRGMRLQKIRG